jgi:hypothetical protein
MEHAGQVHYFCSDVCQKKFVADPEKYASGAAAATIRAVAGMVNRREVRMRRDLSVST